MKGKRNEKIGGNPDKPSPEFEIGYIYRIIEEDINAFADASSTQLSGPDIAARVGAILVAKARRQLLRLPDSMRHLRGSSGEGSSAVESVEVASLPHQDSPPVGPGGKKKRVLSKKAIAAISKAQRKRWAKYKREQRVRTLPKKTKSLRGRGIARYWARKTAAERSAIMKARRQVALQNMKRAA